MTGLTQPDDPRHSVFRVQQTHKMTGLTQQDSPRHPISHTMSAQITTSSCEDKST